jgi:hypothetical protein
MTALLQTSRRLITVATVVTAAAVLGLALSPAARADSIVINNAYQVLNPNVTCETDFDATTGNAIAKSISLGDVTMFSPRYNQTVSYQPILFRWTSSGWTLDYQMQEIFGNTNGVMPNPLKFTLPLGTTSYYRVAIRYRWYWNNTVEQTGYVWAGTHLMEFVIDSGGLFGMSYGDSGDWCHMNVARAV